MVLGLTIGLIIGLLVGIVLQWYAVRFEIVDHIEKRIDIIMEMEAQEVSQNRRYYLQGCRQTLELLTKDYGGIK